MGIVVAWILLSVVAGMIAVSKRRSGVRFFLLSVFLTPIVGILAAAGAQRGPGAVKSVQPDSEKPSEARVTVEMRVVSGRAAPRRRGTPTKSQDCWVPADTAVTVRVHEIPGGMIYVGRDLPAINDEFSVEPALIDPSLTTSKESSTGGVGMDYWPSYSTIPPECRTAYLEWLAGGRCAPDAYVGYVFLFVYGLERRLLADSDVGAVETRRIVAELERLLGLYAANGSFDNYVRSLLEFVWAGQYEDWGAIPPLPSVRYGFEPPLAVRVAVGQLAAKSLPLDGPTAFTWAKNDPQIYLRTPATRCAEEFEQLFLLTYQEEYGAGLELPQCKRRVRTSYRPASASFGRQLDLTLDLPDVTSLVGPRNKIRDIVTSCTDALDSYSRLLGRRPESHGSVEATALLPDALIRSHPPEHLAELRARVETVLGQRGMVTTPSEGIMDPWLPADSSPPKKSDAVEACRALERLGFGVAPDIRFDGTRIARGDKMVLFRLSKEGPQAPTPAYCAASTLLSLAVTVASADGELTRDEAGLLQDHVSKALHLDALERARIIALLEWLTSRTQRAPSAKRVLSIDESSRRMAAQFLVGVACVDGVANPAEVRALTKIYAQLGLDPDSVHQDLHSALGTAGSDTGPVSVIPAGTTSPGYRVPKPDEVRARSAKIVLSGDEIAKRQNEAAAVARMLNDVFSDEPDPVGGAVKAPASGHARTYGPLDVRHSLLLERLGQQAQWSSTEFDTLVTDECQLLPDGAIEMLNEYALEKCDELLLEGEDVIHVNEVVCQEMLK